MPNALKKTTVDWKGQDKSIRQIRRKVLAVPGGVRQEVGSEMSLEGQAGF